MSAEIPCSHKAFSLFSLGVCVGDSVDDIAVVFVSLVVITSDTFISSIAGVDIFALLTLGILDSNALGIALGKADFSALGDALGIVDSATLGTADVTALGLVLVTLDGNVLGLALSTADGCAVGDLITKRGGIESKKSKLELDSARFAVGEAVGREVPLVVDVSVPGRIALSGQSEIGSSFHNSLV